MTNCSASGAVTRISASVERYDREKGEGLLLPADGSPGIPCRRPALAAVGLDTLLPGAVVECEAVDGGRGLQVSRILSVEPPAPVRVPARPRRDTPDRRGGGTIPAEAVDLPGTVKFYNPVRGFGFVAPDGGGPEVFVHASVLERCGMGDPIPGQRVLVRAESVPRGLQATGIGPL